MADVCENAMQLFDDTHSGLGFAQEPYGDCEPPPPTMRSPESSLTVRDHQLSVEVNAAAQSPRRGRDSGVFPVEAYDDDPDSSVPTRPSDQLQAADADWR